MDLKQVAGKLKPNEKLVLKEVDAFLAKLNSELKKHKLNAEAAAGGSIAKGTFLKGDHDVDLFVKFSKEYLSEKLADHLEKALSKFKFSRVHGSRDYFQIKSKNFVFEIIPVYNVSFAHEIVNITDASPLHVKWVKSQFEKKPELADQIRLVKAFCKAQGVYGAESYIKGFSGHVLDILVIYYGGFMELLKNAVKWSPKQVIDFYNTYKGKAVEMLNPSKTDSPLVLVDPVQSNRNAAASLSNEKFYTFIEKAEEFLKNPSAKFFEKKKFSLADIKKRANDNQLILLHAKALEGKEDIVGSKLLKSYSYIRNQLVINNFKLHDSGWNWDKKNTAIFWYITDKKEIPKTYNWEGPPVNSNDFVKLFKDKHKITFEKDGRVYAVVERKFTKAKDLIKSIITEEYIKEKVKSIK